MKLQFLGKFRADNTPLSDIDLAKTRLLQYMAARNKWEVKNHKRLKQYDKKYGRVDGTKKAFELARQELQPIIDSFFTKRDRKYLPGHALGDPPEYNPKHEKITDAIQKSSTRIEIETVRTGDFKQGFRYMYVIFKQDNEWRLDSRKIYLKSKGGWTTAPL